MANAKPVTTCLRREPGKLIIELHIEGDTQWSTNPDLDQRLKEDHKKIAKAFRKVKTRGKLGRLARDFILALVTTKMKRVGPPKHVTYNDTGSRPQVEEVA